MVRASPPAPAAPPPLPLPPAKPPELPPLRAPALPPQPGPLKMPPQTGPRRPLSDSRPPGTHVTGIIGASGNNGLDGLGVTWGDNVKVLACKVGGRVGAAVVRLGGSGLTWGGGIQMGSWFLHSLLPVTKKIERRKKEERKKKERKTDECTWRCRPRPHRSSSGLRATG